MSNKWHQHRIQYTSNSGAPIVGSAGFYATGTSTPLTVYTTKARDVAHTNPVNADSNGVMPAVWFDSDDVQDGIKVVFYDAIDGGGSTLWTDDPYEEATVSESGVSESWAGLQPPTTGEIAEGITITDYSYSPGNLLRYGVDSTGATDVTALVQSAIDCGTSKIYAPAGTYLLSALIELDDGQILCGDGIGQTIFKIDGSTVTDYSTGLTIFGIGAKSGIACATYRDFEFDGNASNNRAWGGGSWDATAYQDVEAHGLWFGTTGGRTVPTKVYLDNVYVRDVTRSGVHWESGCEVEAGYVKVKNSDAGALVDGTGTGYIRTLVLEGHSRSATAVLDGCIVDSINVSGLTANGTFYSNDSVIETQGNNGVMTNVTSLRVNGINAAGHAFTSIIDAQGDLSLGSVDIVQTGSAGDLSLVYADEDVAVTDAVTIHQVTWTGALNQTKLFYTPSGNTVALSGYRFRDVAIVGQPSGVAGSSSLIDFLSPVQDFTINGLTQSGFASGKFLNCGDVTGATFENVSFKGVRMDECASDTVYAVDDTDLSSVFFEDCRFLNNATVATGTVDAAGTYWNRCQFDSLYSENKGEFTATVTAASETVTHNLIGTPESILLRGASSSTSGAGIEHIYIDTVSASSFDAEITGSYNSGEDYFWSAAVTVGWGA